MGLTLDESALLLELEDVYWSSEGLLSVQITLAVMSLLGALALGLRFLRRGERVVLKAAALRPLREPYGAAADRAHCFHFRHGERTPSPRSSGQGRARRVRPFAAATTGLAATARARDAPGLAATARVAATARARDTPGLAATACAATPGLAATACAATPGLAATARVAATARAGGAWA
jgi:hypothetical protein